MTLAVLAGLLFAGLGCAPGPTKSAPPGPKDGLTKIEGLSKYALAQPISYGNVTLVPIVDVGKANPEQNSSDYVSLADAKKNGWIEIHEMPDGAQVNTLVVKNLGKKPIVLLAGELLLGGQQDRIVAVDTVVPVGATLKVPVYCVEPDRWEGPTKKFEGTGTMVPQSVREEASYGDQDKVWSKVKSYNSSVAKVAQTQIAGSSVKGGLLSGEVQTRINTDLPKFQKGLSEVKNVVGFVYVLNGEVQTAELFGDPRLFQAGHEGLLKGFLADAAVSTEGAKSKVSLAECADFLKDVMAGKRDQNSKNGETYNFSLSGTNVKGREASLNAAKADFKAQNGYTGFVHGTYSKKAEGDK